MRRVRRVEGLETGGLETGGLETGDPKRDVARQYDEDLSGKNGSEARMDAILDLIRSELSLFANRITFTSGNGISIHGRDGMFVISGRVGANAKNLSDEPEAERVQQWQLRLFRDGPALRAQIRSGTLTGLGLTGWFSGWSPDDWNTLGGNRTQVWIRLTVSVSGSPYTYTVSDSETDTVWLPSRVTDASADLFFTSLEADAPDPVTPTISPTTGDPETDGIYYFRLGYVDAVAGVVYNDYLGPLGLGWCPPDSPYLIALT